MDPGHLTMGWIAKPKHVMAIRLILSSPIEILEKISDHE